MITTDDLRFFLSLASTRSLAQAARALDVTPPAVTQRLNALEKRLGVRLVNRSGRGTAPDRRRSPAGAARHPDQQ